MLDLAESALQRQDYPALAEIGETIAHALSKRAALLQPLLLITKHLGEQPAYKRKAFDILMVAVRLVGFSEKEGAHMAQKTLVDFVDTNDLSDIEAIAAYSFVAQRITSKAIIHSVLKIRAISGMVARAAGLETTERLEVYRNAACALYAFATPEQLRKSKELEQLERAIVNGFVENANSVTSVSKRTAIFSDAANLGCSGRLLEQESIRQFISNANLYAALATRATTFMAAAKKAQGNNLLKSEALAQLVLVAMRMGAPADRMPFLYDAAELAGPDLKQDVLNAVMQTGLLLSKPDERLSAFWYVCADAPPSSNLFRAALRQFSQTVQRMNDKDKLKKMLEIARNVRPDNAQALRAALDPLLKGIESAHRSPRIPTSERTRAFMLNARSPG